MDFFDAFNRQNITGRFATEFVGTMAGTDGNCQCVKLSLFNKVGSLIRIGQELITSHLCISSVTVFFVSLHGFKGAKASQFAFDADTDAVSHIDHLASNVDIVVIAGNSLTVSLKRAVHHD